MKIMRILIDQAVYDQRNKGNVALLQAAINRLNGLWPEADIYVLTEAPYSLKLYCPRAIPVSVHSWQRYSSQQRKIDLLNNAIIRWILRWLLEFREEIWHRYPDLTSGRWIRSLRSLFGRKDIVQTEAKQDLGVAKAEPKPIATEPLQSELTEAIQNADIIVATGGGYLCDADRHYTIQVFKTLEVGVQLGKPTFMVGQGVGPLNDPELRMRLSKVLPCVDLILIREPKVARPLLSSLGVNLEKVIMTGDDAVEMGYMARRSKQGNALGVNLRIARYTEVDQAYIKHIQSVLQNSAKRFNAPMLALPTSSGIVESDLEYIRQIFQGHKNVKTDWYRYDQPLDLIHKVAKCRVVVTGSYHPAVFALAQGIPVVGLVKSTTYIDKFSALQDEFGPACQLLFLDDDDLKKKLEVAIASAWTSGSEVKDHLVSSAARLSRMAQDGYDQIYNVVQNKLNDA